MARTSQTASPPQPDFAYHLEPWQADAACNDADPTLFHFDHNERGDARKTRETQAKAICATCPVITACADYATRTQDPHGIYAGNTAEERGHTQA